jgi:hypothetical protein
LGFVSGVLIAMFCRSWRAVFVWSASVGSFIGLLRYNSAFAVARELGLNDPSLIGKIATSAIAVLIVACLVFGVRKYLFPGSFS